MTAGARQDKLAPVASGEIYVVRHNCGEVEVQVLVSFRQPHLRSPDQYAAKASAWATAWVNLLSFHRIRDTRSQPRLGP